MNMTSIKTKMLEMKIHNSIEQESEIRISIGINYTFRLKTFFAELESDDDDDKMR